MEISTERQQKIEALEEKFSKIDQKLDTHLEGLLWQKPITYWDYIQTDALLNLQIQRSTLPDEMVFIMYHQRSEEHTSELQSRPHLVCRLLLEKKKNKK